MDDVAHVQSNDGMLKNAARMNEEEARLRESGTEEVRVRDGEIEVEAGTSTERKRRPWGKKRKSYSHAHFKVYKRRWFGLAQLVLLNVVVSWDVSTFIFNLHLDKYDQLRIIEKRTCLTTTPVANLRPRIHILSNLLQRLRNSHKLAGDRLPLLLRRQLSHGNLPAPPRPERQHPRRLRTFAARELDPVCRHANQDLRNRNVWANLDWIGATFCSCGADEI